MLTGLPVARPSPIPLPAPLSSTPVTALPRSYGRSDSCAGGSSAPRSMNTVLTPRRSPCVLCHAIVTIPSPPTVRVQPSLLHANPQGRQSPASPQVEISPVPRGLIDHVRPYRVRFLRTGHSPPVALHLVSRRRSYRWLQAGERLPGEDLHLSVVAPLQAHVGRATRGIDRETPAFKIA
jgi:hypothetical protein